MRIGLTSPFAHPHVWRGAERYLHDFAAWLTGRGHDVVILATTHGPSEIQRDDAGVAVCFRHRGGASGGGSAVDGRVLARVPLAIAREARGHHLDVVQSHHFADALGVRLARSRGRPRYVIWAPGIVRPGTFRRRPVHRAIFRAAVNGAARVHALSRFAAGTFLEHAGVKADVVYPGVAVERFSGSRPDGVAPMILCTAAPEDPRKRVEVLVAAFPLVRREVPEARLVLASPRAEPAKRLLSRLSGSDLAAAEIRENLPTEELAKAYRSAAVSVLPSVKEAFGLVAVESLAAGTPVVASRSGALPEIIDHDAVGRLVPPDEPDTLAAALVTVLKRGTGAEVVEACRRHATQWSWEERGPEQEQILVDLADT